MSRVLVIESDGTLRTELATTLTAEGHEVESAASAQAGLALARASTPDIVLFDLLLPDLDGIELCRALRASGMKRFVLIVLTRASDESTRVAAFEAGVDDYVTKPHSTRELVLRIRALARRRRPSIHPADLVALGALVIHRAARRVDVGGSNVDLTRREFDLLLRLAERAGHVQTRELLIATVWGDEAESERVVDTTVKRLRKKLGHVGSFVKTVRGVGYKLSVDPARR